MFALNTHVVPPALPLPFAFADGLAHVLAYRDQHLSSPHRPPLFLVHEVYDLEEKPVGSALDVTRPAAVLKTSTRVGTPFAQRGVPQLLLNEDASRVAAVFRGEATAVILTLKRAGEAVTVETEKQETDITAFAWGFASDKYATISDKQVFVHVSFVPSSHPQSLADASRTQVWLPTESEPAGLFGGWLLGVELTPTEAEMRTTHIHSQQLQFYGWDVLPAEQEAAAEGESAATEWKRHEHLKNVGARLPCPATVLRVPEAGLLLLAYHDRTAM